jgi:hypothetical protein
VKVGEVIPAFYRFRHLRDIHVTHSQRGASQDGGAETNRADAGNRADRQGARIGAGQGRHFLGGRIDPEIERVVGAAAVAGLVQMGEQVVLLARDQIAAADVGNGGIGAVTCEQVVGAGGAIPIGLQAEVRGIRIAKPETQEVIPHERAGIAEREVHDQAVGFGLLRWQGDADRGRRIRGFGESVGRAAIEQRNRIGRRDASNSHQCSGAEYGKFGHVLSRVVRLNALHIKQSLCQLLILLILQ